MFIAREQPALGQFLGVYKWDTLYRAQIPFPLAVASVFYTVHMSVTYLQELNKLIFLSPAPGWPSRLLGGAATRNLLSPTDLHPNTSQAIQASHPGDIKAVTKAGSRFSASHPLRGGSPVWSPSRHRGCSWGLLRRSHDC